MRRYFGFLLLGIISTTAKASASAQVFEQLRHIPQGWKQLGAPHPEQLSRLHVALHPQNVEKFEQTLLNISSPGNALYGKHMSRDKVDSMLKPADESRTAVWNWLMAVGVPSSNITDKGEWLQVTMQVRMAESMLNNTFFWYLEESSGHERIRTLQYSIPVDISKYISVIQPTTCFGQMRAQCSDTIFCLPKTAFQEVFQHTFSPGMNMI